MNPPGFLRTQGDAVLLSIKLQPRGSSSEIGEALGDELRVKVTAPPVDSAANEALVKLIAKQLDCPRSQVQLVRGQTSRHKILKVQGLGADAVLKRLFPPA